MNDQTYDYSKMEDSAINILPPWHAVRDKYGDPLDTTRELILTERRIRIFPEMAMEETNRYMKQFILKASRNELAVFGQFFSEKVQDMLNALKIDKEAARLEEELELEEDDHPLIIRLERFDPDTTAAELPREEPYVPTEEEAFILANLCNDKVIIRGPYGQPFAGGFQILDTGNLVYILNVPEKPTIPGTGGRLLFQVDITLWKFFQHIACIVEDKKHHTFNIALPRVEMAMGIMVTMGMVVVAMQLKISLKESPHSLLLRCHVNK